jgi:large subunit ribosomal protein L19
MNWRNAVTKDYLRNDHPDFRAGDTVIVSVKITEGIGAKAKTRIQDFKGVCIRRHNDGISSTFTVRKISSDIGVERIFPLHSPMIDKIKVDREGKVRQSRIYYIRELSGRKARIKSRNRR